MKIWGRRRGFGCFLMSTRITIFKATRLQTTNDYLMVSCLVCLEIELRLMFIDFMSFMWFGTGAMVIMMWSMFNLVTLVFTVIFQCKSVSLGMFSFWMDELQLMLVASNFDWVVQVLLIFFLNVDWHGMIVDELNWLMWFSMLVINMMMMLSFGCVSVGRFLLFARMLVNDTSQCDSEQCEQKLRKNWKIYDQ